MRCRAYHLPHTVVTTCLVGKTLPRTCRVTRCTCVRTYRYNTHTGGSSGSVANLNSTGPAMWLQPPRPPHPALSITVLHWMRGGPEHPDQSVVPVTMCTTKRRSPSHLDQSSVGPGSGAVSSRRRYPSPPTIASTAAAVTAISGPTTVSATTTHGNTTRRS